jgi:GNAT superfamily N-acetyltransferase
MEGQKVRSEGSQVGNFSMNIRPVNLDTDIADLARLFTACDPTDPVTEAELRAEFQRNLPGRVTQRLVAVDENEVITGYFNLVHVAEAPANHFYIWSRVDPAYRGQGIGSALWAASLSFLQAQGVTCLSCEVMDNDPVSLAFAERRGFSIDRHHYSSTLNLTSFDETPFQPGIAALEAQGIRFCSLADFPDTPETRSKFYELNLAVVKDIPGESWDFAAYPQFFEQRILGTSWFRREGQLLAVDGETWAGFASIQLLPEARSAYNATTGVIRAYRGRKIALALKIMAVRYARQHGAQTVRTDNDSLNAPILAVNQKMGYQPQPGTYQLVRWLKED